MRLVYEGMANQMNEETSRAEKNWDHGELRLHECDATGLLCHKVAFKQNYVEFNEGGHYTPGSLLVDTASQTLAIDVGGTTVYTCYLCGK